MTDEYSPEFEAAWENYPKRDGGNSKRAAYKQWEARIKEGVDPGFMLKQTVRYKLKMQEQGKIGTEKVMQGVRFYGRNREFENDWGTSTGMDRSPDWNRPWGQEKPPTEPTVTEGWQIKKRGPK